MFSANQNFTTDTYPDIVGKLAFDPGFGHYELKGAARFFTDRFNTSNHTNIGGHPSGGAYQAVEDYYRWSITIGVYAGCDESAPSDYVP